MGHIAEDAVLQFFCLIADGVYYARVIMAEITAPPGRNGIKVTPTFAVKQIWSFALDDYREVIPGNGRMAGVGVPEMAPVNRPVFFRSGIHLLEDFSCIISDIKLSWPKNL
jgi:hypothetical protein